MLSNEELLLYKCYSLDKRETVVFEKKIQFFEANEWVFSESVWKAFFSPKREPLNLQKKVIGDSVGSYFFNLKKEVCLLFYDSGKLKNLRKNYEAGIVSSDLVNLLLLEIVFALYYNFLTRDFICENWKYWVEIADKSGAWKIRCFIEDKVFLIQNPRQFKRIKLMLQNKERFTHRFLAEINVILSESLEKAHIHDFEISFRQKNLYGVYQKLIEKKPENRIITDLFGFRIIVEAKDQCYPVLEILHDLWKPLPLLTKDYIKHPKNNGYQSLHTTCSCLRGELVEFQIRTRLMDYIAKYGPASHALYKQVERTG